MQIQCTFFSHPLISFLLIVSRSFSPKCLLCQNEMCAPRQRLVSCIQRMKMFAFDSRPAFDCVCVFLIFPCCPRLCAACCFCTQCTKWVVWDRVASCVSTEWNEFASRLLVSLWHGNNDTFLSLSERRDEQLEQLRPVRDRLCDLFGVPRPVLKKVGNHFRLHTYSAKVKVVLATLSGNSSRLLSPHWCMNSCEQKTC